MFANEKRTKIVFNGNSLADALKMQNISPENFFGKKIQESIIHLLPTRTQGVFGLIRENSY